VATPSITSFVPSEAWPGSLVEIFGSGFAEVRDDNVVDIGGVSALTIDADPARLRVMVGPGATSGAVEVTVGGQTAVAADQFKVLPVADAGIIEADGPPAFFDGPQRGTPQLGVKNQRVLVILCFPTDQDPGAPVARQALKAAEQARFADANRFWKEASYDSTTWAADFTDWLALPQSRNHYIWQQDDIDDARRRLLGLSRRGVGAAGNVALAGYLEALTAARGVAVVDVGNPASPVVAARVPIASLLATGVSLVTDSGGNLRAYVSAGSDGLHVLDLATPSAPTTAAHVPFPGGQLEDVDANASVAVVAARENGLYVYDLTLNPPTPVAVSSHGFGAGEWATAVSLLGSRAFVAAGATLRVVDVSDPANPVIGATASTSRWAMDLDTDGALCAVATDGDGLHLFDVAGAVPVPRSVHRTAALRLHGVALNGGFAYVAAGDRGLRVVDVANPVAPVEVANLSTPGPALGVAVSAGRAYVTVGARSLAIVDVSTPATPTLTATIGLGVFSFPPLLDLKALQDAITTAENLQAIAQRRGDLLVDAFRAAQAAGSDPAGYEGVIVVVNGPFLRGQSWTTTKLERDDQTDSISFGSAKGVIYLATGAAWGRWAHEIGHWLKMADVYAETFADGSVLLGTAARWDMGGNHDEGPLFSGYHIDDVMHFYDGVAPPNVDERTWSPSAGPMNETFEIVAHGTAQDATANRIHLLKLIVAQGLAYYVEVRQQPGGYIFDGQIPTTNPEQGAVLVTRGTDASTLSNTRDRRIEVFDILDNAGDVVVDAARRLKIELVSKLQDNPLVYRVRVEWNQPDPSDPAGKFDLSITEWSTQTWESIDIWVDSPRNQLGTFEYHQPGKPTQPVLNGDRPWINHVNKIIARVRNTGGAAVADVFVSFYVTSPPGIGDNGNWATLGTRHLPTLGAADPSTPGSGTAVVDFDWVPASDKHTCLRVEILPKPGEIGPDNNLAQENVAVFDSAGGSSHQPVLLEAEVRSPFVVWRRVDTLVRDLPPGWHCAVDHAWLWLPPKGTKPVSALIWTDIGTPAADRYPRIPTQAHVRVEGWTDFYEHCYLPIGGILAAVKATRHVVCQSTADVEGDRLLLNGCLTPPLAGVPITIEVTDAAGQSDHIYLATRKDGCFNVDDAVGGAPRLPAGTYTVQVFVTAGGDAAETECEAVTVRVR
jgi:hypothetical protein